jgi:pimeloyl-ACP methyl ester carboxylesterase
MPQIELSAGRIEYRDSGGNGPPVVLLHGLLMDAALWEKSIALLSADHRCVAPTLPWGAHRVPARDDADLSLAGMARLVDELIDGLGLSDVTLVGSDTGGALIQLLVSLTSKGWAGASGRGLARVTRIVLLSCEAFDNLPARVTGTTLAVAGHLPPWLFGLFLQQLRLRAVRRMPMAFGWLTARGDAVTARWIRPVLTQSAIRRDATRALRSLRAARPQLLEAAGRLHTFTGPALVIWARGDRVMPPNHGRQLAAAFTRGELIEVDDSRTLIPLDQPETFAELVRHFVRFDTADSGSSRRQLTMTIDRPSMRPAPNEEKA